MNEIEEKIHVISPEWEKRYGPGKSLVPRAVDIERLINQTRKGQLLTNDIIRETLAKEKNVLVTEPMTTGIHLRFIAEAAEEEQIAGREARLGGRLARPFPKERHICAIRAMRRVLERVPELRPSKTTDRSRPKRFTSARSSPSSSP